MSAADPHSDQRLLRWLRWVGVVAIWGAVFAVSYRAALGGEVYAYKDLFRLFLPDAHFLLECLRAHDLPLWIPYERLGQPFAAKLQAQAFYPLRLVPLLWVGAVRVNTVQQLLHVPLAAWGTFRFARAVGRSQLASALAALAFSLSPMFTHATWVPPVVDAAAWSGWVALAAVRLAERPSARGAAWLALPLAMAFLAGSPETVLWESALAVVLVLARRPTRVGVRWVLGGALWAFALCAPMAIPGLELARESMRASGGGERLAWSLSWAQLPALALPHADVPRTTVWGGDQWYFNALFLGALVCVLAVVGARGRGVRRGLAVGAVACVALAMGEHLAPAAALWQLPGLAAFRYPVKVLLGASFCLAVLAAFGADRVAAWLRRTDPAVRRAFAVAGLGGLATALALLVLPALGARSGLLSGALWFAAVCLGTSVVGLVLPGSLRRSGAVRWWLLVMVACEAVLFLRVDPVTGVDPPALERPSVLAAAIPRPYSGRISVQLPYNEVLTVGASLEDYLAKSRDALVPLRFVEEGLKAAEGDGAPEPKRAEAFLALGGRAALDLSAVGYFVRRGPSPYRDLRLVRMGTDLPTLYAARTTPPRAFLATRTVRASDREVLLKLSQSEVVSRDLAYLADGEELPGADCEGTARITRDEARTVELAVDACARSELVIADAWFPGWTATVDGQPVRIDRADYALRGVTVEAGHHTVVFHYLPASFRWGCALGAAAWLLLALALLRPRARPDSVDLHSPAQPRFNR